MVSKINNLKSWLLVLENTKDERTTIIILHAWSDLPRVRHPKRSYPTSIPQREHENPYPPLIQSSPHNPFFSSLHFPRHHKSVDTSSPPIRINQSEHDSGHSLTPKRRRLERRSEAKLQRLHQEIARERKASKEAKAEEE